MGYSRTDVANVTTLAKLLGARKCSELSSSQFGILALKRVLFIHQVTGWSLKLSVYHPGVFSNSIKLSLSVKNTLCFDLMYYSGNMFRLAIESSSGPYIKIQILNS
jgi:hypothetical protein